MLEFITEKKSCWDILKSEKRPIFIYGMGDGALKIMRVFEKYSIALAGIFASDDFVRGHYFEGYKVHTLSEIEQNCDDFVIVLAFAVRRQPLYDLITDISHLHTLYAPDVPVAGDGLFTYEYCLENADNIHKVYEMLADEQSRKTFADVINFKISGKIEYLSKCTTSIDEVFENIIKLSNDDVYIDLGAYNGDTIEEFIQLTNGNYQQIYAVEPSTKNFKRLTKNIGNLKNIKLINGASWDKNEKLSFINRAGRMSAIGKNAQTCDVQAIAVDDIIDGDKPTYIKLDVEGAEQKSILGAKKSIANCKYINCSIYHRNEDIFALPILINSINPQLKLYIRHHLYIPAWETNLYATI